MKISMFPPCKKCKDFKCEPLGTVQHVYTCKINNQRMPQRQIKYTPMWCPKRLSAYSAAE